MKQLNTLTKTSNTQSPLVKKKKIILENIKKKEETPTNKKEVDKIDVLFELEKKALSIQRNVRRLFARKKMEQLLVMKLIQGGSLLNKNKEEKEQIEDNEMEKQLTFKKENSNSSGYENSQNSIDKNSHKNIVKNKTSNLLGLQKTQNLNDSVTSLQSAVSKVSINSDELDFSDDDDDEYFNNNL